MNALTPAERITRMAAAAVPGGPGDAPIIECPACLDSGWEAFECSGQHDCGRRRRHLPHTYARPCNCRPMNRTYQDRASRRSTAA